ncbi:putative membrane protein YjcC [Grimontia celer]|uniref:Putative membrane protein YjcC n=1 Tax=Grimontia celer TaxID=1796497 RepID=A0A128F6E6_9GAMM|nr:EAL domain-containing protein [Grimontia celer]CZF81866.1 putative membrane protein YjcC [Grimontia celer]
MKNNNSMQHLFTKLVSRTVEGLWSPLRAVRDGMLWLVPCLILSNTLVFTSSLLDFFGFYVPTLQENLTQLIDMLVGLYPYFFAASISSMFAIYWRLPRPPVVILNMAYVAVTAQVMGSEDKAVDTLLLFVGLTLPLYAVPLLSKIKRFRWTRILNSEIAGKPVKDSMNLMLPGVIVAGLVAVVAMGISWVYHLFDVGIMLQTLHNTDFENSPIESGAIFASLNSVLWFLGIHGYYALTPLVEPLVHALEINRTTVMAGGEAPNVMNLSTMALFVFVGGAGSTLGLSFAVLMFSKSTKMRLIALTSIPLGLFNINELLLFGLPIIFNLRLFLPFLLTPLINVWVAVLVLNSGLVTIPYTLAPLTSPVVINAYIATGGDIAAVIFQIAIVVMNIFVYLPFLKMVDEQASKQNVYLPSLDTTYTRKEEEAYVLSYDPVRESLLRLREIEVTQLHMESFSHREFFLEFQPQISCDTRRVVGVEALIRVKDQQGNVELPGDFLPVFEKAQMMSDIDMWVVDKCVEQCQQWMAQGLEIPISVNITADTLSDKHRMDRIVTTISSIPGLIHIEITEGALLGNEKTVGDSIRRLHKVGASVHIDDFGTGYSSLSYLNRFDIDALKIDQSFVRALADEKGKKVFNGLIAIAHELGMKIIVEGVETQEQYNYVAKKHDVKVQGWYFARSMGASDFFDYSERYARA